MDKDDARKKNLLAKYRDEVEASCKRTKKCAKHLHNRRDALNSIEGNLAPFFANEICTYLLTKEDKRAIIEEMLNKYGLNNTDGNVTEQAVKKIAAELESFAGDNKAKAVSKFVASTLTHFCEENERFAEVIQKTPRTLSDCCADVMKNCGSAISDIDVYRGAVRHYFPNADVFFKMEIHITGDAPTEEEINRIPEKKPDPKPKRKKSDKAAAKASEKKDTPKPAVKPNPEVLQLSLF